MQKSFNRDMFPKSVPIPLIVAIYNRRLPVIFALNPER